MGTGRSRNGFGDWERQEWAASAMLKGRGELGSEKGSMAGKEDGGLCQGQGMGYRRVSVHRNVGFRFRTMAVLRFWFPGMAVQGCPSAGGPTHPSPPPRTTPSPSARAINGAALLQPWPQRHLWPTIGATVSCQPMAAENARDGGDPGQGHVKLLASGE